MKSLRSLKRFQGPFLLLGLLCLSALAQAAVLPENNTCVGSICFGMPRNNAIGGENIDFLINITHVFNLILFVIMCVWMGWACFKHNHKHEAEYDHGSGSRSVTIALCISAFIFAVVDGNLYVNTLRYLNEPDKGAFWNFEVPEKDPSTIKVELNAHQWAWDFRYAGPDGKFNTEDDIVTWNELRVPKGRPVYIQLASTDVIHSFYLPNFRTKQDAMPGMINRLWFRARDTGEFDIGCAQHCGVHHYKMKGHLTVVDDKDFQAWEAEASANSKRAYDPEDSAAHWGWEWKEL